MSKKVAVVIGGSAGMGKHISRSFAKSGYDIGLTYKSNRVSAIELKREFENFGIKCCVESLDVLNESDMIEVSKKFFSAFGRIDVLINNVGIYEDSLIKKMDLASWCKVIDVNLTGVFLSCREFVKIMEEQKFGRIINIGSVVGSTGAYGAGNYSSSKAGLAGLTKSLALESARYNITVNMIALGYMNEGMGLTIPEKIKEKVLSQIPLRTFGDAEKVSKMIVHIASEEAEYLTGQVIGINGGLFM